MVEERHLPLVLYAIVILTLAVFFFSQGTQGSENILCLYKCYSRILNIKVSIILGNLLRETKRFISRTEEAKIGVGRIRKSYSKYFKGPYAQCVWSYNESPDIMIQS